MKTLLILVLVVALVVVAVFTKPKQADFEAYYRQQQGQDNSLSLKGVIGRLETDNYLKSIVFTDKLLYVTVDKDGQRQYLGAFGHWFKSTPKPAAAAS